MEDLVGNGSPREDDREQELTAPLAAFHPNLGVVNFNIGEGVCRVESGKEVMLGGTRAQETGCAETKEESSEIMLEQCSSAIKRQIVVHDKDGPYLMDTAKWPKLTDPEQLGGSQLTQEEDLMDDTNMDEMVVPSEDDDTRGWVESVSKKKKRKKMKKKTNQVAATRASSRVPRDGVPIADKAMARAKERNDFLKGNRSNSFTVLKDASTAHLRGVILDVDITCDDIDAQIEAFRAEEAIRADLAKANYQVYLENLKKKTAPQGEDELED
jgi:hypothetical protein